jgi:hypothetical protein
MMIIIIIIVLIVLSIIAGLVYKKAAADAADAAKAAEAAEEAEAEAAEAAEELEAEELEAEELEAEAARQPVLYPYSTPLNDNGDGNHVYLDRHDIKCPTGQSLNNFTLDTQGKKMQYKYGCVSGEIGDGVKKRTPDNKSGGVRYLDRHNVDCGSDKYITQAKINRGSHSKWNYDYTCSSSDIPLTCRNVVTAATARGGGTKYLGNQHIKCNDDEGLSQFRMLDTGGGKSKYTYRCCKSNK